MRLSTLRISAQRRREQAIELDAALTDLGRRDSDLVRVVEWHFFGGMTFQEIGDELGRHERTVRHDWELARACLREAMDRKDSS
jgi:DNA-directed RNA polymerase specialized sigma24 family protein